MVWSDGFDSRYAGLDRKGGAVEADAGHNKAGEMSIDRLQFSVVDDWHISDLCDETGYRASQLEKLSWSSHPDSSQPGWSSTARAPIPGPSLDRTLILSTSIKHQHDSTPSQPDPTHLIKDMDPPTAAARTDAEATTTQNQTGITPSTLRKTLLEELQATHVEIEDMSGMAHGPSSA